MDPIVASVTSTFVAVLGLVIVALACDRLRWRRLAEDRWLFIEDCKRAANVPSGICFGPTFLRIRDDEQERISEQNDLLRECLAAMEERRDFEAARADAVTGQARRWAQLAHAQRESIWELTALLSVDPERIVNRPVIDAVNELRELAVALLYRHRTRDDRLGEASRIIHVAADVIERGLLRMPCDEGLTEART